MKKIRKELIWFMEASEKDVFARFNSLPTSIRFPLPPTACGDAVFIPGTLPNRLLLVAHYDTVWDEPPQLWLEGDTVIRSAKPKVGIGADDRAGCTALWFARNSGHSLLIVPGEEKGCLGSRAVIAHPKYKALLEGHRFAVQLDRRGANDLVYYQCSNHEFEEHMQFFFPSYKEAYGSSTDIRVLCPELKIAGVNISIGFTNEHTPHEQLLIPDFARTCAYLQDLLRDDSTDPFPYSIPPKYQNYKNTNNQSGYFGHGAHGTAWNVHNATPRHHPKLSDYDAMSEDEWKNTVGHDEEEWKRDYFNRQAGGTPNPKDSSSPGKANPGKATKKDTSNVQWYSRTVPLPPNPPRSYVEAVTGEPDSLLSPPPYDDAYTVELWCSTCKALRDAPITAEDIRCAKCKTILVLPNPLSIS